DPAWVLPSRAVERPTARRYGPVSHRARSYLPHEAAWRFMNAAAARRDASARSWTEPTSIAPGSTAKDSWLSGRIVDTGASALGSAPPTLQPSFRHAAAARSGDRVV